MFCFFFFIRLVKQSDRELSHEIHGKQWKEFSTALLLLRFKLGRNMTIHNEADLKGKEKDLNGISFRKM